MPGNSFIWSAKPPIAQISVFLITKVYKYIHRTEMLPRHSSLKTANMTETFPIPDWQLIWVKFIYMTDLFQVNFQGIYCCITTILTHHLPRILYWSVTNLHSHMLEGKNCERKGAAERNCVHWLQAPFPLSSQGGEEGLGNEGVKPGKKVWEVNFLVLSLFRIILLHF